MKIIPVGTMFRPPEMGPCLRRGTVIARSCRAQDLALLPEPPAKQRAREQREQERRDARAAGMDGFVAKPIDAQELLRVLMPLRPPAPGSAASAAPRPAGAAEPQADANAS